MSEDISPLFCNMIKRNVTLPKAFSVYYTVVKCYYGPGGPAPPPQKKYLAQTIVKVGFGPPQYLRQKGPRMILEAQAPQTSKA